MCVYKATKHEDCNNDFVISLKKQANINTDCNIAIINIGFLFL